MPGVVEASAPGKVLILGGYLIVQSCTPANVGISIGVNARFTTRVLSSRPSQTPGQTTLEVRSPQFHQSFTFCCTTTTASGNASGGGAVGIQQTAGPSSLFIYYAILYTVAAARMQGDAVDFDIVIELLADNDFYSQRNYLEAAKQPVSVEALRRLPKHLPLVGEVSKTGLGSSAAMTTSIVACLGCFFHQRPWDREVTHRIAQVAHSVTQGKIGSGFDVFTAVYGTCAYRRFPASRVTMMMGGAERPDAVDIATLATCVDATVEWVPVRPFHLPRGVTLVLGDVHQGGSATPGMVAKIMGWHASVEGTLDNLWEKLRQNNETYIQLLHRMTEAAAEDSATYDAAMQRLQRVSNLAIYETEDPVEHCIIEAAQCASRSRTYLREMGTEAEVKVEPAELTELLDATAALPGVLAVGCPGAGGYDAVFALVLGEQCGATVESFWEEYKPMNVCPLLVREDPSGLEVKSES